MTPATETPKGVIGESHRDGLPVIWKFVDEAPTTEKMQALPWMTVISWRYDGGDNNGMPPSAINERMKLLERTFSEEVESPDFCEHAISKTGSNLKELIYYIHDRDTFMDHLNRALKSHERYPIEIDFYEDGEWKEHANTRSLFGREAESEDDLK